MGEGKHIYFNARYYDPEVGRFLTEDPSRKGTSWYTYCANNPLTVTDPTGMREIVDEDEYGRLVYADPKEERREREPKRCIKLAVNTTGQQLRRSLSFRISSA